MNQNNHEAGDPAHKLAPHHAGVIAKVLELFGFADSGPAQEEAMDRIQAISDEDDDAMDLTAEQAKLAADHIRDHAGDESEHADALKHLDAVAEQHGSTGVVLDGQTAKDLPDSDVDADGPGEGGEAGSDPLNAQTGTHGGGLGKGDVGEGGGEGQPQS